MGLEVLSIVTVISLESRLCIGTCKFIYLHGDAQPRIFSSSKSIPIG